MRKLFIVFSFVSLLFSGCSEYQKLLKNDDHKLKYKTAIVYYNNEEFVKASTLFEQLGPIYVGTSKAQTIDYYKAYCSYGQGLYLQAQYEFERFTQQYGDSSYAEECLYMSAFCYYKQSPKPRLDQLPTKDAIDAFQLYINRFPNSTRVDECNGLIDELQNKMVYKSYLSARNYYDRGKHPSAIVALKNSLKDYPGSKYREDLMFMLLQSRYELASRSVESKKLERYNNAQEEYFSFIDEFPKSKNSLAASTIASRVDKYLSKYSEK